MTYELEFHPDAWAEWNRLDNGVRAALKKKLAKRLESPHVPASLLRGDLANCYKLKNDSTGHRLVYEVIEERVIVYVLAVGERARLGAYRVARHRR